MVQTYFSTLPFSRDPVKRADVSLPPLCPLVIWVQAIFFLEFILQNLKNSSKTAIAPNPAHVAIKAATEITNYKVIK